MSVEAIKWAFDYEAKNSSEKAVLLALANYADGEGRCYPGQESIAKKASCSDRTVRTVLADLEARGVITREERRRKDGSRTSDSVVITALSQQPENPSGCDDANRKISSQQPENPSGLTTFEPPVELPEDSLSETGVSDAPKLSRKKKSYPEDFERSWSAYPTDPNMSKKEAFEAWQRLDETDRAALEASIPAFRAYCAKNPDYRPIHMVRFIRYRRFDGFVSAGEGATGPDWPKRLAWARANLRWSSDDWGPMPGRPGCLVPPGLVAKGDGEGWQEWSRKAA